MTVDHRIYLRDVIESDLPELFAHQQEPEANEMAAFPARTHEKFMAHWKKILADDRVIKKAVVVDSEVAGHVVCFKRSGKLLVGYWLGRKFWGRGIASKAVAEFVSTISARPLHAYVAKHNVGSIRVLENCGFERTGESRAEVVLGGELVDDFIYKLTGERSA